MGRHGSERIHICAGANVLKKKRIFCITYESTLSFPSPSCHLSLAFHCCQSECYPWQSRKSLFLGELHAVCNYKWGWAWSLPTIPAPMPQHTHICTRPNGSVSQTRPVCSHSSTMRHSMTVQTIFLAYPKPFLFILKFSLEKLWLPWKDTINGSIHGKRN